ncbi:MAG: hypothetical protein ACFE92_15010 [Promethearchaeota archaeon]
MKKNRNKKKKKIKPLDAWAQANIERLARKPEIQKMFGFKAEKTDILKDNGIKTEERQKETTPIFSKFVKQMPYIIIAGACAIAVFTFIDIYYSIPFGIYWYLSIIMLICFIILYIILSKNEKKSNPDIIKNESMQKILNN